MVVVRGPEELKLMEKGSSQLKTQLMWLRKQSLKKIQACFFFRLSFLICVGYVFIPHFKYIKINSYIR